MASEYPAAVVAPGAEMEHSPVRGIDFQISIRGDHGFWWKMVILLAKYRLFRLEIHQNCLFLCQCYIQIFNLRCPQNILKFWNFPHFEIRNNGFFSLTSCDRESLGGVSAPTPESYSSGELRLLLGSAAGGGDIAPWPLSSAAERKIRWVSMPKLSQFETTVLYLIPKIGHFGENYQILPFVA